MNRPRNWAGAMVLCSLGLAAYTADASTPGAGGDPEAITLRFGTNDFPGRPAADQIEEFGRQVDALTDGEVQIEGVFEVGGFDGRNWDQVVAQQVIDGELDGGNVPARAWDRLGVTSMTALHAPFLVTTDAALNAVVSDDELVADMLAGLDGSGVTGLGIAPEAIRHLFAFGDPLVAPADFEGALIRTPASATGFATFEALGAVPDDIPDFGPLLDDGTLAAIESQLSLASFPEAIVTANLAPFPKADVLVVNDDVFAGLSDEHQAALTEAAEATRDWAITSNTTDVEIAARFCEGGWTIVNAADDDVAAIRELVQPVYDDIAADPANASILSRIEAVVASIDPGPAIEPCDATTASTVAAEAPAFAIRDLDGVYEFELLAETFVDAGFSAAWVERESAAGVQTVTLDGGAFSWDGPAGLHCEGTYTIAGSVFTFRWTDGCFGDWSMMPTVTADGIGWSDVVALAPWNDPESQLTNELFNASAEWIRVDDVGTDDPATTG